MSCCAVLRILLHGAALCCIMLRCAALCCVMLYHVVWRCVVLCGVVLCMCRYRLSYITLNHTESCFYVQFAARPEPVLLVCLNTRCDGHSATNAFLVGVGGWSSSLQVACLSFIRPGAVSAQVATYPPTQRSQAWGRTARTPTRAKTGLTIDYDNIVSFVSVYTCCTYDCIYLPMAVA